MSDEKNNNINYQHIAKKLKAKVKKLEEELENKEKRMKEMEEYYIEQNSLLMQEKEEIENTDLPPHFQLILNNLQEKISEYDLELQKYVNLQTKTECSLRNKELELEELKAEFNNINTFEEEFNETVQHLSKVKSELQQYILLSNGLKEQNSEYQTLLKEKTDTILFLEKELENNTNLLSKAKEEFANETTNIRTDITLKLEEIKKDYESKTFEMQRTHKIELDRIDIETKKKLENILFENKQLQGLLKSDKEREISSYIIELTNCKTKITELQSQLENKDKIYNEYKLNSEKNLGETQDVISQMREQIQFAKDNMTKLQKNYQDMNNKFMFNLHKHKECLSREISARDELVKKIETELDNIKKDNLILKEQNMKKDQQIKQLEELIIEKNNQV